MATGSDMSQLKENLAQYEAQLHQVLLHYGYIHEYGIFITLIGGSSPH